jgi:GH43 family beta-xylosidase
LKLIKILVLGALVLQFSTCGTVGPSSSNGGGIPFNTEFYNPVTPNIADPCVVYHDGMYYMSAALGNGLGILKSKTLSGFMAAINTPKIVWWATEQNLSEVWAPEIHFVDGYWYAYMACLDKGIPLIADWDNRRRSYVLKSRTQDPEGAWDFIGKLELPDNEWAIDGTLFINDDEKLYFIWSGIQNSSAAFGQRLYICEMESPSAVKEGTHRVQIAEPEFNWEKDGAPIVEGPVILKQPNGAIKCIYSASHSAYNGYCLGELTLSGDPMDAASWAKRKTPLLQGDPLRGVYSPGHNTFTTSPDGTEIWMVYHTAQEKDSTWNRNSRIQKVNFNAKGDIVMNRPLSGNETYTLPSGELVDRTLFEMENGVFFHAQSTAFEGAHGGRAARFLNDDSSVELEVDMPQGEYMAYVRYTHSFHESWSLKMELNGVTSNLELRRCGGSFSMIGGVKVFLPEGKNTLVFRATPYVLLDSLILEKL